MERSPVMKVGYETEIIKKNNIYTSWNAKQWNILLKYTLYFKYYLKTPTVSFLIYSFIYTMQSVLWHDPVRITACETHWLWSSYMCKRNAKKKSWKALSPCFILSPMLG